MRIKQIKYYILLIFLFLLPYQIYFNVYKNITISVELLLSFLLIFLYRNEILSSIKNKKKNLFNLANLFFIIFLFITFISTFYSINYVFGLQFFGHYLIGFILLILFSSIKWDECYYKEILFSFISGGFLFSIILIIFYIRNDWEIGFLHSKIAKYFIDIDSLRNLLKAGNNITRPWRAGVFFGNTNFAALFLGMYIPLIGGAFFFVKKKMYKILFPALLLIFLTGLFSTGSRAGLLSFIIIFFIIIFFISMKRNKFNFKYLTIGLLIIVLLIMLFSRLNLGVFRRIKNFGFLSLGREKIYEVTIKINKERFFTGYGADMSKWSKKQKKLLGYNISTHNIFLEEWGRSGIFSAISLLFFYILVILKGFKTIFKQPFVLPSLLSVIWAFMQINLTNNIFAIFSIYMLIYLHIGIIQYFHSKNFPNSIL